VRAAGDALATLPERGRPGRWPGTRELVIARTPFVLAYRLADGTVQILRVLHGRRAWPERPIRI
jgi:toxin ParE1/3/4